MAVKLPDGCVAMGTSWYDLNIWRGMRDFASAYAHIIAAYHLRLDDGYAAVGCVRGQYKKQMPEYKDDAWCEPRADFLRFLERGAARGVLPFWWGPEHQAQILRASSLLGYALTSAEEPVDFLRAYGSGTGPGTGAYTVNMLRDLGDMFEGKAAWERRTDRDEQEHREPLIGRRQWEHKVCPRCRAGIEIPSSKGFYRFPCPFCEYLPPCPKCGGAIGGGGCCGDCGAAPSLYVRINTCASPCAEEFALLGARLACAETLPALRFLAIGDVPDLREEPAAAKALEKGSPRVAPDGTLYTVLHNANDHLHESESPELLDLLEASHMFGAGCAVIKRALKLSKAELEDPDHMPRTDAVDVPMLKAGCQLVADAYFAADKCVWGDLIFVTMILTKALAVLQAIRDPRNADGFAYSAMAFEFAAHVYMSQQGVVGALALTEKENARKVVDAMLSQRYNQLGRVRREGCPHWRRHVGRLLSYRSFDKLTRLQDKAGSEVDLGLAIKVLGDSPEGAARRALRAPLRMAGHDQAGAMKDYRKAVEFGHPDDRHAHSHHFALAFLCAKDGDDGEGRAFYARGRELEARHRYLFGDTRQAEARTHLGVLEMAEEGAHRKYATDEERCDRLIREYKKWGLERRNLAMMDLPAAQVRRFNAATSGNGNNGKKGSNGKGTADDSASSFSVGDAVLVHGLQSEGGKKHNGSLGVVVEGLSAESGRYAVAVRDKADPSNAEKSTTVKLKPSNLQPASQAAASHQPPPRAPKEAEQPAPPAAGGSGGGGGGKKREKKGKKGRGKSGGGGGGGVGGDAAGAAGGGGAQGAMEDMMSQAARAWSEEQSRSQRAEDLSRSDADRLAESRAALAATTDVALNESQPEGDGDQSFARAALESDPGFRLRAARTTGMDFSHLLARGVHLLAPFAQTCLLGDFERGQSMIRLAEGSTAQLRKLLETRVSMMRMTPLMLVVTGATTNTYGSTVSPQHAALARCLLEAGARPNAKDVGGFTAFHYATNGSNANDATLQIASMLPQYGGDPNVRNRFGMAPLIEAVMSARLDVIECLVHAGADSTLEDQSMAALSPSELKAADCPSKIITPVTLARLQPKVLKLFSRAELAKTKMEPVVFTCSAAGCDKPAPKTCSICLRSWYCSAACQKADWKTHKASCKRAAADMVRIKVHYDTFLCQEMRSRRDAGAASALSKPFKTGHPHTIKVQLPLSMTEDSSDDAVLMAYTRLSDRIFEIRSDANGREAFREIVSNIRRHGPAGGLKGYFNAWAAGEYNAEEKSQELNIDARCMKPAQAF